MDVYPFLSPVTLFVLPLILIIIVYKLPWKPNTSSKKSEPPKAGGAWPIAGHLPMLGGSEPPHKVLGKLADKYGPIFTIKMGVHKTLIVSDYEIARECYTTNDRVFADRPEAIAVEHMGYNYAMFGFSPYGPYWRDLRKIATQELLSNHRLAKFEEVRESEVQLAIRAMHERSRVRVSLVDMKDWFGELSLNVSLRMVVGKRNEEDGRFRAAIRDFFRLAGTYVVGDAIPWLRWFDFGGYERDMKMTGKKLDELAQGWLDQHKRSEVENDFMGVMLSLLEGSDEICGYDSDTVNKSTCLGLILGGTDTTTVTLIWALALLLNNRKALRKVQQELDDQVGRERQVRESDIKNLVYLQAVIKETLRLYPSGPLLVPRLSSEDCTIAGHHIPKKTRLLVNASKLQRDPKVWSDPNEFVPERFLKSSTSGLSKKDIDFRGQSFEFIPFGAGRRICPGISFALQVSQLVLASLLHGFEVTTVNDEAVDMTETTGLLNQKASPLDVLVTPRLAYYLYD